MEVHMSCCNSYLLLLAPHADVSLINGRGCPGKPFSTLSKQSFNSMTSAALFIPLSNSVCLTLGLFSELRMRFSRSRMILRSPSKYSRLFDTEIYSLPRPSQLERISTASTHSVLSSSPLMSSSRHATAPHEFSWML